MIFDESLHDSTKLEQLELQVFYLIRRPACFWAGTTHLKVGRSMFDPFRGWRPFSAVVEGILMYRGGGKRSWYSVVMGALWEFFLDMETKLYLRHEVTR